MRDRHASDEIDWAIVSVTFLTLVVIYGVWYSFSVFLVALVRQFGWSRSLVSGAFSCFVLLHGILGPIVGWLARRYGPRRLFLMGGVTMAAGLLLTAEAGTWWQFYLAYSGVTAIGISMAGWVPCVILIQGWCPKRFGTAMGVASAGIGVGMLILVPFAQVVIERLGWPWAFRLQAVITVAWLVPAACWWIRNPPGFGRAGQGEESRAGAPRFWTLKMALRSWRFWGVAAGYFTGNVVTQMLIIHQVAFLVDHGMAVMTAATVGGIVGLATIGAKVTWGILSDRAGRELAASLAFGLVVLSIGTLVLAGQYPGSALPYVYAVLIAFGYGVLSPVFPAIAGDLFGGPGFSTIYGTLYGVICLGLALGPWMAGKIFDVTGSYGGALWLGLAMAVVTPSLLWLAAPRRPNPVPETLRRIPRPPSAPDS
jgi:MFS family permease